MTVWFTSDLHIGHATVAKMRFPAMFPNYNPLLPIPLQPNAHDLLLAHGWDSAVRPDDIVWVLGDISAGGKSAQLKALEWIKERPGIKHLITGNHDGCHPMHRDSHKWQRIYLEAFESVQMAAKRRILLSEGHVTVLLSHFPYEGDHTAEIRYPEWRLRDCAHPVIHGHTHSDERISHGRTRGLGIPGVTPWSGPIQIHVGVDAWDFKPVSLDEIAGLL